MAPFVSALPPPASVSGVPVPATWSTQDDVISSAKRVKSPLESLLQSKMYFMAGVNGQKKDLIYLATFLQQNYDGDFFRTKGLIVGY